MNVIDMLVDRVEFIENLVEGKDVLDLGCVQHKAEKAKSADWLHGRISAKANVLGVDIEQKEVEKLRKKGYNMVCANVETMRLNKKFDVVVAGEIIEHVSNPGLLLDTVKKHLKKGGILVLTTPNAEGYFWKRSLGRIKRGKMNKQHVAWYDEFVLRHLLERHGFKIKELHFCKRGSTLLRKLVDDPVCKIKNHLSKTILVVATPITSK